MRTGRALIYGCYMGTEVVAANTTQERSGAGALLGLRSPDCAPSPTPSALDRHIHPDDIVPLHPITNPSMYVSLYLSMKKYGWQGRALLAATEDNYIRALTGSHRIQAARDAHVESIPVYVLDGAKLTGILVDMGVSTINPTICREALRRYGDATAIALFAMEETA